MTAPHTPSPAAGAESGPFAHRLRVAHLNGRAPNPVTLAPDAPARRAIAEALGLLALPALRLTADIRAIAGDAWEMTGRLTGRVVQPCVVTLAPVETAIDEEIHRVFSPHATAPEGEEVEMPDADVEPLGQFIDAGAMLVESLSLALPLYPRAEGAAFAAPEETDASDEAEGDTRKPFAGLADLLGKRDG